MEVREFALKQEFAVRGNYPGQRTVSFLNEPLKKTLRESTTPAFTKNNAGRLSPISVKYPTQ
jgi:hypothetical protein